MERVKKIYFISNMKIYSNLCLILNSLSEEKIHDEYFPGFDFVIQQLSQLKDYHLLWQYLDWAMAKNQKIAIRIFTERSSDELASERMRPDAIIEYLLSYREALELYLEYLIYTKNLKVNELNLN